MSAADLDTWLDPLIAAVAPAGRAALARGIASDLKASQARRIRANLAPDGTPYPPRIPQARARRGAIRRGAMFRRIGGQLRAQSSADGAEVGWSGRAASIALVHQDGRTDRVRPGGPSHRYAMRELLGFSSADLEAIEAHTVASLVESL
jgi:phage virion morphogenesis protein